MHWGRFIVGGIALAALVASSSCMIEDRYAPACRGRVQRYCDTVCYQVCDRWGCAPECFPDCYDVCAEGTSPPAPRPIDAGRAPSADGGVTSCTEDNQCPGGTRCSLGRCVSICLDDRDCPSGWSCLRGLCADQSVTPTDAGARVDAEQEAGSDAASD